MRVGVFLDVDGVITDKAVNLQFAQLLGVEDGLKDLEERYARAEITNDEFNAGFIPLFRNAKFTKAYADRNFENIQRRVNCAALLATIPDTHLVTSGPSYYMYNLAKDVLPSANVLCSEYEFDEDGLLARCTRPVNMAVKGHFVKSRVGNFDITIGVGDTDQDIEFLSHCDVRIMMHKSNRLEYLSARELQPIIGMLQKFAASEDSLAFRYRVGLEKLYKRSPYSKNIFIMTPYRNDARYRETIQNVKSALKDRGYHGWLASDASFEPQLWDNIRIYLLGCCAGIAIFTDDIARDAKEDAGRHAVYNPNVSIEAGYMMAHPKPILLLKEKKLQRLPSDMLNFLYRDFDMENSEASIRSAVDKWLDDEVT
jgi:phosphoserine phosphatase